MKTLCALLAAALLTLGAFAACGGDDDDAGTEPTAAEETEGSGDASETPEATDEDDGDDDAPSGELEEYFAELEEIGVEADDALTAVGESLNAVAETDEEYVTAVQDAFLQAGQIRESALLRVADLEPPPEAEAAQETFIATLTELLRVSSDFYADLQDATTAEEVDALFSDYDLRFTEAQGVFDAACFALQDIAAENGIEADLRCG